MEMSSPPRYVLEPLAEHQSACWDELIAPYESAQLFHRSPWLDYLAASRGIDVRLLAIRDDDTTVGYFCGGLVRKGPFRVLGSPLKGWGTNCMGPIVAHDAEPGAVLRAVDDFANREGLAMVELEGPALHDSDMPASGFEAVRSWTYRVSLTAGDPDRMWRALDSTARNRIRKAFKAGLTVEDTDDPAIADEFYDQYSALVKRKGFKPPYLRDYPRLLVRHLKKADLLFALRVRDSTGRVLATGLFPHDDRVVYFWGGASWREWRDLCPNEFLHWSLMRLASQRGLRRYDMCGHGRFKKKFGGTLVELKRWHKCYWRSARWARKSYELYYQTSRHLVAWPKARANADHRTPVAKRYELEPVTPSELRRWDDLITAYESCELFHRRVWLDYLAVTRGVDLRFWVLRDRGRTVGYFSGAVVKKGPFRILGSPLKGWTTNFMGPVVNRDFDQAAFLRALDELAAREGFAMLEIENSVLGPTEMNEFGYEGVAQPTYVVELTPDDPDRMWKRIDLKSRQKVRKAKKLGLIVEDASDDPRLADEFYDQFVEVLARKSLFPPYGPDAPRRLIQLLKPHDMLLALQIREPNGSVIASGLFPHDGKTLYFWGGASRLSAWNLSPNDLLQWAAMERGAAKGLRVYNMCGYGYFKSKFGGVLLQPHRWHKSYWASARFARRAYARYFEKRIRLRGWWQRIRREDRLGHPDQQV
jgi:lipid II:glycine glycyltransferase (peptidoglycan interpeptide bridge formation enzyme)